MTHIVTILMIEFVTHDVKRFVVSKPEGFTWQPGQGVTLVINQPKWVEEEGRPFTPTGLTSDRVLEFIIKRYAEHQAVTDRLHTLRPGDELLMSDPFGTITYKGPGTFIAAGAGMTPFLAIIRQLASENKLTGHRLLFANKTPADIFCEKELCYFLGDQCLLTCTRKQSPGYDNHRINKAYLAENITDFNSYFYVCGPNIFVEEIKEALVELGVRSDQLVLEE